MHQTTPTIFSPEWLELAEGLTIAGNEWTPEQLKAIDKRRTGLAIARPEEMKKLLDTFSKHRHFSISGPPGSGKSTEVVKIFARAMHKHVLLVERNRLASVSVSADLAVLLGVMTKEPTQAEIIVLRNGNNNRYIKGSITRVAVVTEGIEVREVLRDVTQGRYGAVVFDHVQEESGVLEVLMAFAKWSMQSRGNVRFAFISSNYNMTPLREYLGLPREAHFDFPARTYPLLIAHAIEPVYDLAHWVVRRLAAFIATRPGDVLIFAAGLAEGEEYRRMILKANLPEDLDVYVISASSSTDAKDKATGVGKKPRTKRRITISTNIIQGGITIVGAVLVIDTMKSKLGVFNPEFDRGEPVTEVISAGSADQRAGCVGRTQPGFVDRAMTRSECHELYQSSEPKILHEEYTSTLLINLAITQALQGRTAGYGPQVSGNLLELRNQAPPALQRHALIVLESLGAVVIGVDGEIDTARLTTIGLRMASLTASPEYARSLIASEELGCVGDMILLIAANSVPQDIFIPAKDIRRPELLERQQSLMVPDRGDQFSPFNALRQCFGQPQKPMLWAKGHALLMAAVAEAGEIQAALRSQMGLQR